MTANARIYFAVVSRLKRADLPFASMRPGDQCGDCALIITSSGELVQHSEKAIALEDLDENPGVFKGQLLSKLDGGCDVLLIGIDPGTRIGLAVFYGEVNLEYNTFSAASWLSRRVGVFVRCVPARKSVVRVGNGSPAMASKIVDLLKKEAANAIIELVDETGTSVRRVRMKGIQGDQGAAAKIAFRKGEIISLLNSEKPL